MESSKMTVSSLCNKLKQLQEAGCGDFTISFDDGFIYEDGYGVNYLNKQVALRGNLFRKDELCKIVELRKDIEKAFEKFERR